MDKELLTQAQSKFKKVKEYWSDIYQKAREDLHFLSDEPGAQWDSDDYNRRLRAKRPALTIDQMSQFVNQASNDIRMNTPSINVIPHAGGADIETAEIIQGKIRDIELQSGADDAYDTAVNNAIKCSIGFIRIDHDYADDESFEQELTIDRVVNPLAVFLDDESIEPDGSDAKCGYVLEEVSEEDFKEQYPGKEPVSFGDEPPRKGYLYIAEYFKIKEEKVRIGLTADGEKVPYEEGREYASDRFITKRKVYRYKLSGADPLEEGTFPGKYIPIVPVYGEEAWAEGKRHLQSLIRKAKDPQRMYNYWKSMETELLMKQQKAPFMAAEGQTEDWADDWTNPDKSQVLRYKTTDAKGNPVSPPIALPQPVLPVGITQASKMAVDDIKATMGLYNAWMGHQSNETSGVAIRERKSEGDRAIYHYGDNLVRSITQVGRILVSAFPDIYDTPRQIRIIDEEENAKTVGINGEIVEGQSREFSFAQGQYSVRVTTGQSFATMRQESADFFERLVTAQPEMMQVMGDLLFRNLDLPGAQAIAARMEKLIDPKLLDEDEELSPQAMAAMQENEQLKAAIMELQAQVQEAKSALDNKQAEIQIKASEAAQKSQNEQDKMQVELAQLRLKEQELALNHEIKVKELAIKEAELRLREIEANRSAAILPLQVQ